MDRQSESEADAPDPSELDLEELLSLTAHELHEPLRKISAFGDMLKEHAGPALDRESLDYLERIERATERMRTTLSRVIAFARVPRGLPFVTIDLEETAFSAVEKLRDAINMTGGTVVVEPLPFIAGDPFQMQQLFEQLLDNAMKFRKPEEAPVVKITTLPDPPAGLCAVRISDNGEGFDNVYAERIFRPFERLHGKGKYPGAGLGLAICQKIARRHGGKVIANGTPGVGAVFTALFPALKTKSRNEGKDRERTGA
ncbi:MAG: hypothetical protein IPK82_18715 [Polyangiaceae bacterium]|nr:hypothetical protein [Polyangiaceae bacterium]